MTRHTRTSARNAHNGCVQQAGNRKVTRGTPRSSQGAGLSITNSNALSPNIRTVRRHICPPRYQSIDTSEAPVPLPSSSIDGASTRSLPGGPDSPPITTRPYIPQDHLLSYQTEADPSDPSARGSTLN